MFNSGDVPTESNLPVQQWSSDLRTMQTEAGDSILSHLQVVLWYANVPGGTFNIILLSPRVPLGPSSLLRNIPLEKLAKTYFERWSSSKHEKEISDVSQMSKVSNLLVALVCPGFCSRGCQSRLQQVRSSLFCCWLWPFDLVTLRNILLNQNESQTKQREQTTDNLPRVSFVAAWRHGFQVAHCTEFCQHSIVFFQDFWLVRQQTRNKLRKDKLFGCHKSKHPNISITKYPSQCIAMSYKISYKISTKNLSQFSRYWRIIEDIH